MCNFKTQSKIKGKMNGAGCKKAAQQIDGAQNAAFAAIEKPAYNAGKSKTHNITAGMAANSQRNAADQPGAYSRSAAANGSANKHCGAS